MPPSHSSSKDDVQAPAPAPAAPRAVVSWLALLGLSLALTLVLHHLRLPAALLLGPLAAAILFVLAGGVLAVPRWVFYGAQGLIGCMIARVFSGSIFVELLRHWLYFVITVGAVFAASTVLGYLLARWRVLPGTTAVWGSSPGAATAMVLMAEAYGADVRLVAFMQYLRVLLVVLVASLITRFWAPTGTPQPPAFVWFPPVSWSALALTLAVAWIGAYLSRRFRLPAGALPLPLVAGVVLQNTHVFTLELPPWVLAPAYAVVGWSIGLQFTRAILLYAVRALPAVLAAIVALMAACGALAVALVWFAGLDPLTAYLATSPGGADSVAILAASTHVDVPFVMSMQTGRFLLVVLAGPRVARWVANRLPAAKKTP